MVVRGLALQIGRCLLPFGFWFLRNEKVPEYDAQMIIERKQVVDGSGLYIFSINTR
jgi:hypothetical protein